MEMWTANQITAFMIVKLEGRKDLRHCEMWAESLRLRLAGLSVTTYPLCLFGEVCQPLGWLVGW